MIGSGTITLSDPIWVSHGRFKHGVSAHCSKGRVFLAGDAGHFTLPIGGQSMDAGVQDAIGLAWRLAMALASYSPERQGEHARLDKNQATGLRPLMYRSKVADVALDAAAAVVPNLGSKLFGSDDLRQLLVGYPESPLSDDRMGLRQALRRHVPHAGDRASDADMTDGKGNPTTLFARVYNPDGHTWGWPLLAFDSREEDAGPPLPAAMWEVAGWNRVRPRLVLAAPRSKAARPGVTASMRRPMRPKPWTASRR